MVVVVAVFVVVFDVVVFVVVVVDVVVFVVVVVVVCGGDSFNSGRHDQKKTFYVKQSQVSVEFFALDLSLED